ELELTVPARTPASLAFLPVAGNVHKDLVVGQQSNDTVAVVRRSDGAVRKTLDDPSPTSGTLFGFSVAAVGGRILVRAPRDGVGSTDAGAAYLYDGTTGALLHTFRKSNAAAGDQFGFAVAAFGTDVLVGAPFDDGDGPNAGAVYLFSGTTGELLRRFAN